MLNLHYYKYMCVHVPFEEVSPVFYIITLPTVWPFFVLTLILSVQFSSELTDYSKLDNCLFMNGG